MEIVLFTMVVLKRIPMVSVMAMVFHFFGEEL
jgi:hypothetical protein